jgi:hypothetical protein
MINELIKIATHLDKRGLTKEADYLDEIIKKYAGCPFESDDAAFDTELDEEIFYAENLWDMHREMDQEEEENEAHDQVHT